MRKLLNFLAVSDYTIEKKGVYVYEDMQGATKMVSSRYYGICSSGTK
jgi:hypothetical protein